MLTVELRRNCAPSRPCAIPQSFKGLPMNCALLRIEGELRTTTAHGRAQKALLHALLRTNPFPSKHDPYYLHYFTGGMI